MYCFYSQSPNDYKKNEKIIYKILKIKEVEEASLEFRLRKINGTRNYVLSERYKKTCKYFNYVEHLFILASIITGCARISAFA